MRRLFVIGDKLGLYKAMAGAGPMTSAELAAKTGTTERYVREWLAAQAAGGLVTYDAATEKYTLPPEQAFALADEMSPVFLPGAYYIISACMKDEAKITDAFRNGNGVGWHEHDSCLFYRHRALLPPQLSRASHRRMDSRARRRRSQAQGGRASGGCRLRPGNLHDSDGPGLSRNPRFVGFDYHPESIELAREAARKAGVSDRVKFEVAKAKDFPGKNYDFVAFFDCLHDMGDPEGAARHVRETLAPHGTWMIVEPFANDKLEDNLNPIGRIFYAASTMLCTPASLSQEVGLGPGRAGWRGSSCQKILQARPGFTRVRRAAETPFNIVLEARP